MKRHIPMGDDVRWNRLLWGVEFTGSRDEPPKLIGDLWSPNRGVPHAGEPTRALLFCTRAQARVWCVERSLRWGGRERNDIVSRWRLRPVRVRETVVIA